MFTIGLMRLHHHVTDTHHEHAMPVVQNLRGRGGTGRTMPDLNEPGEEPGLDGLGLHPPSQPLCADPILLCDESSNSSRSRCRTTLPSRFLGSSVRGRNSAYTL